MNTPSPGEHPAGPVAPGASWRFASEVRPMPIDPATLKFASRLVRIKVRQSPGLRRSDLEDAEQELLLEIVDRWPKFDPAKGTAEAFVERVVRDKLRNLVRDGRRAKRDWRREQSLDERAHDRAAADGGTRRQELAIDVAGVVSSLPPRIRRPPVVRWLGVKWYGVPAPLRWLMGKQMSKGLRGCGCVMGMKNLYEQERVVWQNAFALMLG